MSQPPGGLLILIIMLCTVTGYGQYSIGGSVYDASTKEPLPFVNIIVNQNPLTGTTSDIQGKFSYTSPKVISSLTFSYVGYDPVTLAIDTNRQEALKVYLKSSDVGLEEIVVVAGENPANRIIRNVIRNKDINNPEKISSFRYTSYNKVIYDFDFSDSTSHIEEEQAIEEVFKGGHLLIMESVAERKFIHPDHSEEVVLGTKVSGFKNASFAPLATDVQPFSFYMDNIPILDVTYLNPISNGSLTKYDFRLEDTLYAGVDTTFILSFKPQPGKNFEALTGLLYINTNTYAIQNVIARPFSRGFVDISLQQQYRFVDGKQWFPEQLKFELIIRQNKNLAAGVMASGTSIIEHVELNPELDKKDFSIESIHMHDLANARDSLYWENHRSISLNEKELTTYEVMDSLGEKYNFDGILKFAEKLGQNRLPVGMIDFDLSRVLLYNKFEGVRLGLGAYTNDKFIRNFAVGGWFGYGFKDSQWKYGLDGTLTLDKAKEFTITGKYQSTLRETGKSYLGFFRPRSFDFRTFLAAQMDRINEYSLNVGFRALRYAKVNISMNSAWFTPQYLYEFQPADGNEVHSYRNTDVTINLRYAYKEKLVNSMGQRFGMGTKWPVLTLTYTRGLKGVLNGDFDYNKLEARVEESIYFRNFGQSRFRLDAGIIDTSLPYGQMFTGEGSFVRNWSVLIKNSFMTVTPYEFLSDRYVHLHYAHNFGSLLLHVGNWKPSISVYQNMGWGSLEHPEYQAGVQFKTKEKGLFESGMQIDNILKLNYLNVSYLGFGAGAFVRYGPYATGSFSDDVVFTFSMTVTTK